MDPIHHRQDNPSPQVEYSEIDIPDGQNFGTGRYTVQLKPHALALQTTFVSAASKAPDFQVSLAVNPANREVIVLVGRADSPVPVSATAFVLPETVEHQLSHVVQVDYQNWAPKEVRFDGVALELRKPEFQTEAPVAQVEWRA
jgi:hypothetical protein